MHPSTTLLYSIDTHWYEQAKSWHNLPNLSVSSREGKSRSWSFDEHIPNTDTEKEEEWESKKVSVRELCCRCVRSATDLWSQERPPIDIVLLEMWSLSERFDGERPWWKIAFPLFALRRRFPKISLNYCLLSSDLSRSASGEWGPAIATTAPTVHAIVVRSYPAPVACVKWLHCHTVKWFVWRQIESLLLRQYIALLLSTSSALFPFKCVYVWAFFALLRLHWIYIIFHLDVS